MTGEWIVLIPGQNGPELSGSYDSESPARQAADALIRSGKAQYAYLGKISVTFSRSVDTDEPTDVSV